MRNLRSAAWLVAILAGCSGSASSAGGGGSSLPAAPLDVAAQAGDRSATVTWSPVSGATLSVPKTMS
jgi:hypothetical protein